MNEKLELLRNALNEQFRKIGSGKETPYGSGYHDGLKCAIGFFDILFPVESNVKEQPTAD